MQRRTPPPNGIQAYDSALAVEEALGPELARLGLEVGPRVHRGDGRHHHRAGRQQVAGDLGVAA